MVPAVAFYQPHSWTSVQGITGHLIAWWTAGAERRFSHCELLLPRYGKQWAVSSSAMDGGWRAKPVGTGPGEIDISADHWVIVPRPDVVAARAWAVADDHIGAPYGYVDLISQQILRLPLSDSLGDFCSTAVMKMAGDPLPRFNAWNPNMYYEYLKLRGF